MHYWWVKKQPIKLRAPLLLLFFLVSFIVNDSQLAINQPQMIYMVYLTQYIRTRSQQWLQMPVQRRHDQYESQLINEYNWEYVLAFSIKPNREYIERTAIAVRRFVWPRADSVSRGLTVHLTVGDSFDWIVLEISLIK